MSLGKLLATGRSLVGGAPDAGRYNLSPRNRLPRFGGKSNPFAPAPATENPADLPPAPAVVPESHATIFPCTASAASSTPAAPLVPSSADRAPRLGVKAHLVRAGAMLAEWSARGWEVACQWGMRAARRFRRPQPSLIPRFGRPVVQPELSLDDVKVIRGDLTESDLEFVEPTTNTVTTPGPKAPVASPKRGPVPPALKKLTDRILGPVAH